MLIHASYSKEVKAYLLGLETAPSYPEVEDAAESAQLDDTEPAITAVIT